MPKSYRTQFSFFNHFRRDVYLDSAATTQKLDAVLACVDDFSRRHNASVHRGGYALANRATIEFESSRSSVADFINAYSSDEVIFTSGATESLNMIAQGIDSSMLAGNVILLSESEHHANILPWQALARRLNLSIKVLVLEANGVFTQDTLDKWLMALTDDVAIFACAHVSNVLGNIYPIKRLCEKARNIKAITVIDGTQAAAHLAVDVQSLGCDFYVFSGHKMYAPTGIGVCWGRFDRLVALNPSKLGGEMVTHVSFTDYSPQPPPLKFEAGTPNISGAFGLRQACAFLSSNLSGIQTHEQALYQYLLRELAQFSDITLLGNQHNSIGLTSFYFVNKDNHDIAMQLYQQGVALRFGQHCSMPLLQSLGLSACLRISIGCYNNREDIDNLIDALKIVQDNVEYNDTTQGNVADRDRVSGQAIEVTKDNQWEIAIKQADNWSEKHRQLLLLSKHLPMLEVDDRGHTNAVDGCEANVWLEIQANNREFKAYSDSKVIRGILAILLLKHKQLINTDTPYFAIEYDYLDYLKTLGLSDYFSRGRKDGIRAVVLRMRQLSAMR